MRLQIRLKIPEITEISTEVQLRVGPGLHPVGLNGKKRPTGVLGIFAWANTGKTTNFTLSK